MGKRKTYSRIDAKSRLKMDLADKRISHNERIKMIDDYFYANFMKFLHLTNDDKQFLLWLLAKRKEIKKDLKRTTKERKRLMKSKS